ncbi:MAG TPA: M12 family metallopeptidase [Thermoanaerobaculia bacterium]|nr:M12 family metallopeptidase [Thermoanaerobaculia bacterium]
MAIDKRRGGRGDGGGERQTDGELLQSSDLRTAIIPLKQGNVAVQYSVVDGLAIFEGDIVLGTVAEVEQQTEAIREGMPEAVVITGEKFRWKNCRIPYTIDPALPSKERVTEAIAHWEEKTNYKFVVRSNEPDWITFRPGTGCSSHVGRRGGQQFVNLAAGCLRGQTIHEIGHVIGLWHEQSREDRDLFVQIKWENIEPAATHNFNQHITDGDDVGPYDYGSIMHYGAKAFSKNDKPTIVPINPPGALIGQRDGLSAGDISAANSLCSPPVTIKETTKDVPLDTKKELVKDIRLDTKKEVIVDTKKEMVFDKRFDPIDPRGPVKFDQVDPRTRLPGGIGGIGGAAGGGNALPFAMATGHQAPGAQDAGAQNEVMQQVMQLDAQLQGIADALAHAQAQAEALQQQYDQTLALLNGVILDQDQS